MTHRAHRTRPTPVVHRARWAALGLGCWAAASGLVTAGCDEEPEEAPVEAPPPAPPKVEIPAYEPTGELAELMREGARGIDETNAAARAKALEAKLDAALGALQAAPAAEATGGAEGADD